MKTTIRTLADLKEYISKETDVKKIEFVLQKSLKTLCIFQKKVTIHEVRKASIDLINEYWINKNDFEKPLFLIIPKEDE
jgi:hypothetical protein